MSEKDREERKKCKRNRKRLQRAKQRKNLTSNPPECSTGASTPYSCKQTLPKAVLKTARALPQSPRKNEVVVQGLIRRFNLKLTEKIENNFNDKKIKDDDKIMTDFYFRPDTIHMSWDERCYHHLEKLEK